jgi:hypothetical protein
VDYVPARGVARALTVASLAGCALSVAIHLTSLAGFYSKAIFNLQIGLIIGIFLLSLPVLVAQEILLSRVSIRDRIRVYDWKFNSMVRRKLILANTPEWLRHSFFVILYYFIAFFLVFLCRAFPNKAGQLDELQMFSACAAGFYSGFAAFFASYARTERPLTPYED